MKNEKPSRERLTVFYYYAIIITIIAAVCRFERREIMNLSALLWPNHPSISIFGLDVYWYAIIIVSGMMIAFGLISLLFKRRNMSTDLFLTYFVIGLPVALVTTRLFYCITDGMPISEWFKFSAIRNGGMSIVGGVIGGAASVIILSLVKKINFLRVGDCVVVGLLLAQSIGRWGNFVNQEVYGAEVTVKALQFFPFAVFIEDSGTWHYAFFFYESLVTFTAAVLLFCNAWFNPKKPNGVNSACYFIVYGVTRTIMEPLRDPEFILGGGIPWSMIMSICMIIFGVGLLFYVLFTNKKKEGKLFGSLNGDPYGITKYYGDKKDEVAYLNNVNMMCKIYPENFVDPLDEDEEREKDEKEEKQETEKKPRAKTEWKTVDTSQTERTDNDTEAEK